jgi:bifunctional pyridoxal-dependent enzyme with beta-cystathionase and maltose regulon repressor activities
MCVIYLDLSSILTTIIITITIITIIITTIIIHPPIYQSIYLTFEDDNQIYLSI